MDNLVSFLITRQQPVRAVLKPDETLEEFVACMRRKFINIIFTDTKGDAEIGIRITNASMKTEEISKNVNSISLQGECSLNFEKINVKISLSLVDFRGVAEVTVG